MGINEVVGQNQLITMRFKGSQAILLKSDRVPTQEDIYGVALEFSRYLSDGKSEYGIQSGLDQDFALVRNIDDSNIGYVVMPAMKNLLIIPIHELDESLGPLVERLNFDLTRKSSEEGVYDLTPSESYVPCVTTQDITTVLSSRPRLHPESVRRILAVYSPIGR